MKVVFLLFTILSISNAQTTIDAGLVEKFLRAGLNRAAMAMRTGEEPLWPLDPILVTNFTFSQDELDKLDPWYIKKEEDFIIKHLDVNGLSHFEVQDMFIDAKSHRGKFKLNIPLLSGQTNVTLKSVYHVATVVCPPCYAFSDIVNTGINVVFNYEIATSNTTDASVITLKIKNLELTLEPGRPKDGDALITIWGLNGAKPGSPLDWQQKNIVKTLNPFIWNEVRKRMKRWLQPHLEDFLIKQFEECNLADKTLESEGCQKLFKTE